MVLISQETAAGALWGGNAADGAPPDGLLDETVPAPVDATPDHTMSGGELGATDLTGADASSCTDAGPTGMRSSITPTPGEGTDTDERQQTPIPQPEERQARMPLGRFRRAIACAALAATAYTGIAAVGGPKEAAIKGTEIVAQEIYQDTPIGLAAQDLTQAVEAKAGWDHKTYTKFKIYHDPEHPTPHDAKVTNFIFTGLREMHGEDIAREISFATGHDYPTRYQYNGDQAIDADYMARQLLKSIAENPLDTPTIGFTCHSMGAMMLIETLDRIQQMGLAHKLPKIAFINFLSSPSGMQTARLGAAGDFITKAHIGGGATGAIISNFFSQMESQHYDLKPDVLLHDARHTLTTIDKGASFALTESQMDSLDEIDSVHTLVTKLEPLKGMITPETKVTYYAPLNLGSDEVVNDLAAWKQFRYAFRKVFGIKKLPLIQWGYGHADTYFAPSPKASSRLRASMQPATALIEHADAGQVASRT